MTRIVAFADTHLAHEQVKLPPGELLLFAGDACSYGTMQELALFKTWLAKQPHEDKIVIAGNHDWVCQKGPGTAYIKAFFEEAGVSYLQDEAHTFDYPEGPLTVYGTPWQPRFHDWAFNLPRDGRALELKWAQVPPETDVLITHGPPHGILDKNYHGDPCGCEKLAERLTEIHPLLHVFGHIHKGYGTLQQNGTVHANVAVCDENYDPTQPPLVFEWNGTTILPV